MKGSGRLKFGLPRDHSTCRLPNTAMRLVVRPICADTNSEGVGRPAGEKADPRITTSELGLSSQ